MLNQNPTYLIIGNGIAGVTAAEILRAENSAATIAVIADDPYPVYFRPALKDYLGGRIREDKLAARPTSFYQDRNILFVKDRVTGIEVNQHTVQTQSGRLLGYHRLLLANGARPVGLTCPGANLPGVTTLRTINDYQSVLDQLEVAQRVVVVGSGTLALETVETLRHRGYEIIHLLRKRTLWSEVLDTTASDLILQQERRDGVDVRIEEEVAQITEEKGTVSGVVTRRGEFIPCDMVIVAIGIEPLISFIKASGIQCDRGVKVNESMRTSAQDVYAAGDIIEVTDGFTNRTRVLGQWYPAIQQARAAAYSMLDLLDESRIFRSNNFYNATFLYGLDFASVGITNLPGFQEIVADPKPRTYRKVLLKDGIPVGMLSLGDRKQALAFKRAIDHRVNLTQVASSLFSENFRLSDWLDSLKVPPAILSVNRTGASVVKAAAYAVKKEEKTVVEPQQVAPVKAPQVIEAFLVPVKDTSLEIQLTQSRLSKTQVTGIGRQPGIQMPVDQGTVSRRHAEIAYANGQYVLRDLGSSNGTFVNEVRLEPNKGYLLKQDDIIRFGTTVKFTFILRAITEQAKAEPAGGVKRSDVTIFTGIETSTITLGQPVLNADGSLMLPDAITPLPASIVASFRDAPALVIINNATEKEKKQPLQVLLLNPAQRTTLGRDKGNDVELLDIAISRQHAEVMPGPDGFYIRDLSSSNGVVVNQIKIDNPYLLSHGDRVKLGSYIIYFIDLRAKREAKAQFVAPLIVGKTASSKIPVVKSPPIENKPVPATKKVPEPAKQPPVLQPTAQLSGPLRLPSRPLPPPAANQQNTQKSATVPAVPRPKPEQVVEKQTTVQRNTRKEQPQPTPTTSQTSSLREQKPASPVIAPDKVVICRTCGRANMRVARFCASCSTPLGS